MSNFLLTFVMRKGAFFFFNLTENVKRVERESLNTGFETL